jgi:fatty-acyl-CoA synthase
MVIVVPEVSVALRKRRVGPLANWAAEDVPFITDSIGDTLRNRAARQPGRTALMWNSGSNSCVSLERMSYAELLRAAEHAAGWLAERAAPGERVALWSRNNVESILLEYGCTLAGLVLAPFNTSWTDFEVTHALALARPRLLFAGLDPRGGELLPRGRKLAADVEVLDIADVPRLSAANKQPLPEVSADAPFLIQFTSGTTGRAKGALLSHRAALNSAWLRPYCDGADNDDVWLNSVPLHHVGGSVTVLLGALSVGGATVVMERHDPALIASLVEAVAATRMGGVPTMLLDLLNRPDFPKHYRGLRAVSAGGAMVPASLVRRIRAEWGAAVGIGYGQSESPMVTSTLPGDDDDIVATTVGRAVPGAEVKIVHAETGATLALGEVGEICVRSPINMDGYFGNPAATAEVIDADGFLHTGDLGSMDEQGLIRIAGRARDVIIRGGENIYPAEVEDALMQHPAVLMAAVVGVDDDKWGQQVAAAVQLRPGAGAHTATAAASIAAELEAFAAERVAHFKVPRQWKVVDGFPLTASGKIRKVEVEALFHQQ